MVDRRAQIVHILEGCGLTTGPQAPGWKVPSIDALRLSTGQRFMFWMPPDNRVYASTFAVGPTLPLAYRSIVSLKMMSSLYCVRVSIDDEGNGSTVIFDGSLWVDPDDANVRASRIKLLLKSLEEAPPLVGLAPQAKSRRRKSPSKTDERLSGAVREILVKSSGRVQEIGDGELRAFAYWSRLESKHPIVVIVKEGVLQVTSRQVVSDTSADVGAIASRLCRDVSYGRVTISPSHPGVMTVGYSHFLGDVVSDSDVMHSLEKIDLLVTSFKAIPKGST